MEFVLAWHNGFIAARYRHDADAVTRYLRDAPDCLRCLLPAHTGEIFFIFLQL